MECAFGTDNQNKRMIEYKKLKLVVNEKGEFVGINNFKGFDMKNPAFFSSNGIVYINNKIGDLLVLSGLEEHTPRERKNEELLVMTSVIQMGTDNRV